MLRGHRDADSERVLAIRGGAPGAVGRDSVGRRQEAIVNWHAVREGELQWVDRVDSDKVPDCLDVGQIKFNRLLTRKWVDESKLGLDRLERFEFGLKRHVS